MNEAVSFARNVFFHHLHTLKTPVAVCVCVCVCVLAGFQHGIKSYMQIYEYISTHAMLSLCKLFVLYIYHPTSYQNRFFPLPLVFFPTVVNNTCFNTFRIS